VGIPLFVAFLVGALYLYIQIQELDSIERRIITVGNVRRATIEQISISFWATVMTVVVAVPLGIALTRPWARRVTPYFIALANVGQGVPAIGTLVIVYLIFLRDGARAAIVGLAVYAILPVLRGTMVGLQQVDPSVIKAARGMGMSRFSVLLRVELPLAVPVLLTGVRTAIVLTVSTSVLAGFIGGGTFGSFITAGFAQGRNNPIWVGSVGAAALAILADWVGGIAEDQLRPKGL
jgi:osmoprotectant transport system permease protein